MRFQSLTLASLLWLGALAQTITTSSPSSSGTDLPSLVAQLPTCALPCFNTAAQKIGCGVEDLRCLCNANNAASLATNVGLCLGLGTSCDLSRVSTVAQQICSVVNSGNVNSAQLSSASAEVSQALASLTTTATSSSSTGAGMPAVARPTGAAMGALGAVAALAVLAL